MVNTIQSKTTIEISTQSTAEGTGRERGTENNPLKLTLSLKQSGPYDDLVQIPSETTVFG